MRHAGFCAAVVFLLAASAAALPAEEDREVTVRFVDASGEGIADAWIRPVRQIGDEWFERFSGSSGTVRVRRSDIGRYPEMCVGAPGYKCRHLPPREFLPASDAEEISIRLDLGSSRIRILVMDGANTPMPGVRVVAKCTAPRKRSAPRKGREAPGVPPPAPVERVSDASGMAVFLGLPPGEWEFDVVAPGMRRRSRTAGPVHEGSGPSFDLRLYVEPEPRLRGVLVDAAHRPIVGAAVRRLPRGDLRPAEEPPAVTDADGRFSLKEAPKGGPWTLEVRLADDRVMTLDGVYDSEAERRFGLDIPPASGEKPSLRGRMVGAKGQGVRAWVSARPRYADSLSSKPLAEVGARPDGTFEFFGLPAGPWRLHAQFMDPKGNLSVRSPGGSMVADPSVEGEVVEFRIPVGDSISGRVVDGDGEPVVGLVIRAERNAGKPADPADPAAPPSENGPGGMPLGPTAGMPAGQGSTGEGGSFLLENLEEGLYSFFATSPAKDGLVPWLLGGASVADGTSGVVLTLSPPRPIRGRVLSPSEEGLEGVVVVATRLPRAYYTVQVRTGKDGVFVLAPVDPHARYRCVAYRDDGTPGEPVLASAGKADLVLFVDPSPR